MNIYSYFRPLIESLDPELAHKLALKFINNNFLYKDNSLPEYENIKINIFNLNLLSPIGLAAGFDKNGEVYNSISRLGFGFTEIGTVTPKPQFGNKRPRVFRLKDDSAIINRLGFPNIEMDENKKKIKKNRPMGICGFNIGPNKGNTSKVDDYLKCFSCFHEHASYITINISSPNTPNLRSFHEASKIETLVSKINQLKKSLNSNTPVLYKISPDISDSQIKILSEIFLDKKINGLILTNTSVQNKKNLKDKNKYQEGGISGKPIYNLSNQVIKKFYTQLDKKIPIIGAGGVEDGYTALEKIKSGASLCQLYTAMIYKGPFVAQNINKELSHLLSKEGFNNIQEAIGHYC